LLAENQPNKIPSRIGNTELEQFHETALIFRKFQLVWAIPKHSDFIKGETRYYFRKSKKGKMKYFNTLKMNGKNKCIKKAIRQGGPQ
jgi:hypothetical protein